VNDIGALRAAGPVLEQHLTSCPGCGQPAAAHVDIASGAPTLVRLVCAAGCQHDATAHAAVIDALYTAEAVA
jgi:hypothetical protein